MSLEQGAVDSTPGSKDRVETNEQNILIQQFRDAKLDSSEKPEIESLIKGKEESSDEHPEGRMVPEESRCGEIDVVCSAKVY